jgi:formyltetrahydrofolate deformylase
MRIEWSLDRFDLDEAAFRQQFTRLDDEFRMVWRLAWAGHRLRIALFVSRYQHCLIDLLHRHQIGELAGDIALVVGNHPDAKSLTAFYGVPFHHFPMTSADKLEEEARQIDLLESSHVDLVVLARYMQVLSPQFGARLSGTNHQRPPLLSSRFYRRQALSCRIRARRKSDWGPSHYVTEQLNEGPIIEQDVARVSHRDPVHDLIQKGRDLERVVLSRAVRWHLERRILFYGNKTVVFD